MPERESLQGFRLLPDQGLVTRLGIVELYAFDAVEELEVGIPNNGRENPLDFRKFGEQVEQGRCADGRKHRVFEGLYAFGTGSHGHQALPARDEGAIKFKTLGDIHSFFQVKNPQGSGMDEIKLAAGVADFLNLAVPSVVLQGGNGYDAIR